MALRSASPAAFQILDEVGLGELPADWEITRIEALLSNDRGISVGVMYPGDHDPSGIPLIKAGDLAGSRINPRPEFRITPEKHHEYRRTRLEGGELLISLVGDVGRCAIVPGEFVGWNAARAIAVLRFVDPSEAAFVRTCLMSAPLQHLMQAWATTTVQATLNLKEIRQLPLPWPPREQRIAIDHILGTLEDKIEVNRRMNETLEAMARAIFKSWFVDFDPVRAKADGRDPGLPEPLADLFPNSFENSELGEIPKEWRVGSMSDAVSLSRNALDPGDYESELFDHFSIPAFDAGKTPACDRGDSIKSQKFVVLDGCVLVSKLNPATPRVWMAPSVSSRRQVTSTEFFVCVGDRAKGMSRELIYCLASSAPFIEYLTSHASGTSNSHQRVRPQDFLDFQLAWSPPPVREAFTRMLQPLFNRIATTMHQAATLATLRDALLPKLVSGELQIPRVAVIERRHES